MKKILVVVSIILLCWVFAAMAQGKFETDTIKTSRGDLQITFLGHGTLYFTFERKVIHIDPYSKVADYSKLPKADVILLTHDHADHL